MKADTPVLNPWQYDVSAHGKSLTVNIEYSRDTTASAIATLAVSTRRWGTGSPNGQYLQIFLAIIGDN